MTVPQTGNRLGNIGEGKGQLGQGMQHMEGEQGLNLGLGLGLGLGVRAGIHGIRNQQNLIYRVPDIKSAVDRNAKCYGMRRRGE